MEIKSQSQEKADIYKAVLSSHGFINPMTNHIIALKHILIIFYQSIEDESIKKEISLASDVVEKFKIHTDDISGLNANSNKKIYEILSVIEQLDAFNSSHINYYKLCLGSVLNNEHIKKGILEFNYYISSLILNKDTKDPKKIISKIKSITNTLSDQMLSDNLAFENLKMELCTRSLSCSLSSMIHKTKQNIILSDMNKYSSFGLALNN